MKVQVGDIVHIEPPETAWNGVPFQAEVIFIPTDDLVMVRPIVSDELVDVVVTESVHAREMRAPSNRYVYLHWITENGGNNGVQDRG